MRQDDEKERQPHQAAASARDTADDQIPVSVSYSRVYDCATDILLFCIFVEEKNTEQCCRQPICCHHFHCQHVSGNIQS
jgi:hypothetical protein